MRHFLIVLMLCSVSAVFAQSSSGKEEITQILQKCMDLPSLQEHYAKDANGELKPLFIVYQHPAPVPTNIILTKSGKTVKFLAIAASENVSDNFFEMNSIALGNSTATVKFAFTRMLNNGVKVIQVEIGLIKTETTWTIHNSKITE